MFDVVAVRARIPALTGPSGRRVFLDGAAGTQLPESVISAMSEPLRRGLSNLGGSFQASREADEIVLAGRFAAADLVNARRPEEIVFGQSMTSLTMALGRALARDWEPGDEIVVTGLDHDANVSPWRLAAEDRGVAVRVAQFDRHTGVLESDAVRELIGPRTRLVAVTHASNVLGSIVDVARVCSAASEVGALTLVDAVHYAPHGVLDVQAIGCDFLTASAYKFFGPHAAILYGRLDVLEAADSYRIRPAPDAPPEKWESGTPNIEAIAGVTAAVDYLASLGSAAGRRARIVEAMAGIARHERSLGERFLLGISEIEGLTLFGLPTMNGRVPTFALGLEAMSDGEASARLGDRGIFTWSGNHYATGVMEGLGRSEGDGVLRVGFVHYNTAEEVDMAVEALGDLSAAG